jgi:hypothetical protein
MADDVDEPTPIERGLLYRLKRAFEAGAFRNLPPPTPEQMRLCNVDEGPAPTGRKVVDELLELWRKLGH